MNIRSATPAAWLPGLLLLALTLDGTAATAPVEVPATSPRWGGIHRFVTLPATLRANQQVTLHSKVAGYLQSITVDRGDRVSAGQVLAEIEMPEVAAERAQHEAELKIARLELERIRGAREKAPDLITPQATDTAEARLAKAEAALAHHATLLQYAKIRAPFAGVITMRHVDPGAFVPAATAGAGPAAAAIVTLMDFSTIRVHVAVPEIEAARVQVGQPVVVTTDAVPGRVFQGRVSRHSGALDETTRSLLVEADLPNADGVLRPGMYVSAKVGVEHHARALLVPAAALVREKAAGFVFILVDGKASRVPVKYGFNDGTSVEILEGLAENARVLVPSGRPLVAGQSVTAVEAR